MSTDEGLLYVYMYLQIISVLKWTFVNFFLPSSLLKKPIEERSTCICKGFVCLRIGHDPKSLSCTEKKSAPPPVTVNLLEIIIMKNCVCV